MQSAHNAQNYTFEDPDIVAYVNGHPVYASAMDQYILMKKAYMKAIEMFFCDKKIDLLSVIQSVADDLEISFEECVNDVYRPFWITEYVYESLLNIAFDDLEYGNAVQYNDANESKYWEYILKCWRINKDYLDSLFEQAEIVERP